MYNRTPIRYRWSCYTSYKTREVHQKMGGWVENQWNGYLYITRRILFFLIRQYFLFFFERKMKISHLTNISFIFLFLLFSVVEQKPRLGGMRRRLLLLLSCDMVAPRRCRRRDWSIALSLSYPHHRANPGRYNDVAFLFVFKDSIHVGRMVH
jgi:hypothetical protein